MKTLYKRLKPKARKAIEEEAKIHPYSFKPVITQLKLVKFADDLSVNHALKVHESFYPRKPFMIHEYYELFND